MHASIHARSTGARCSRSGARTLRGGATMGCGRARMPASSLTSRLLALQARVDYHRALHQVSPLHGSSSLHLEMFASSSRSLHSPTQSLRSLLHQPSGPRHCALPATPRKLHLYQICLSIPCSIMRLIGSVAIGIAIATIAFYPLL